MIMKKKINNLYNEIDEEEKEISKLSESIVPIEHLKNIPVELEKLYNLKYINFRFRNYFFRKL